VAEVKDSHIYNPVLISTVNYCWHQGGHVAKLLPLPLHLFSGPAARLLSSEALSFGPEHILCGINRNPCSSSGKPQKKLLVLSYRGPQYL